MEPESSKQVPGRFCADPSLKPGRSSNLILTCVDGPKKSNQTFCLPLKWPNPKKFKAHELRKRGDSSVAGLEESLAVRCGVASHWPSQAGSLLPKSRVHQWRRARRRNRVKTRRNNVHSFFFACALSSRGSQGLAGSVCIAPQTHWPCGQLLAASILGRTEALVDVGRGATIKLKQLSGDFPLNHNKQKCEMFPNNNHEAGFVSKMPRPSAACSGSGLAKSSAYCCQHPAPPANPSPIPSSGNQSKHRSQKIQCPCFGQ